MSRIRAILADDEPLARKKLSLLLASDSEVEVLRQCTNLRETVESVNTLRPALLFLDVQMPDGDGFEALSRVKTEAMPYVIFTTAYDQYALRAFDANALDYLLKPFDEGRFAKALDRAKTQIAMAEEVSTATALVNSLKTMATERIGRERFVIKTEGRLLFLKLGEIDWLEAASNYVRLHVGAAEYLTRSTMSEVEQKLAGSRFIRIHRSVIVNADRIKEVRPCNSGEFIVTLVDKKELPASRGYRENLEPLLARTVG
jgi:two-component system, LytTR family, response regulator